MKFNAVINDVTFLEVIHKTYSKDGHEYASFRVKLDQRGSDSLSFKLDEMTYETAKNIQPYTKVRVYVTVDPYSKYDSSRVVVSKIVPEKA